MPSLTTEHCSHEYLDDRADCSCVFCGQPRPARLLPAEMFEAADDDRLRRFLADTGVREPFLPDHGPDD